MQIEITAGNPTDAELAALCVVLAVRRTEPAAPAPRRSAWNDPRRRWRLRGSWRDSGLPG